MTTMESILAPVALMIAVFGGILFANLLFKAFEWMGDFSLAVDRTPYDHESARIWRCVGQTLFWGGLVMIGFGSRWATHDPWGYSFFLVVCLLMIGMGAWLKRRMWIQIKRLKIERLMDR